MITHDMIAAEVRAGLSYVCATCERYWDGRLKGLAGFRCTSIEPCGGPLGGMLFPQYRGALTSFDLLCFVCGSPACGAVGDGNRMFGFCSQHAPMLMERELVPTDIAPMVPQRPNWLGFYDREMGRVQLPPASSLAGAILTTEKEWADQDGRPFGPKDVLELCHAPNQVDLPREK